VIAPRSGPAGPERSARPSPREPMLAVGTERVYLHPGQMFAAAHRCAITTVLGSCVAVCLHDASPGSAA
jgi:Chemotaxis protein; stimulates methylation of MCP proteins